MLISSDVSNTCLFAPAPYYKLNKRFFLGFLFKPRGGLPRGLNKKASEKYPLFLLQYLYSVKFLLFSYPSVETCVFGAHKNRLVETVF